jgi:hypothetical protein
MQSTIKQPSSIRTSRTSRSIIRRPNNFLELSCNSATVNTISHKSIGEIKSQHVRSQRTKQIYSWAGSILESNNFEADVSQKSIDLDTVGKVDLG